jgi:SAM-dependent methyltransferase
MSKIKSNFGNRVEFIRKFSNEAIDFVENELDFVYIDANHKYKYVMNDLELWYNKLKSGGFIICDDACDVDELNRDENGDVFIEWGPLSYGKYGVLKACRDFTLSKGIPYFKFQNQILIFKSLHL